MNTVSKSGKIAEKGEDEPEAASDVLAAEVSALRAELQVLVEQVGAVRAQAKGGAMRAARALAAEGADVGSRVADDLLEEWSAVDRRVVEETRARPWRSLGVAALIGLVFGLLVRR